MALGLTLALSPHAEGDDIDEDALSGLPTSVAARLADLEAKIQETDEQSASLAEELLEARRRATDVDRRLQPLLGELEAIDRLRRDGPKKIEQQQAAAEHARVKQTDQQQIIAKLKGELEELQQKLAEAEKSEKEAAEAAAKADQEVVRLQNELAEKVPKIEELAAAAQQPERDKQIVDEQVVALERDFQLLEARRDELNLAIEQELKQAGVWISFSRQLAPILHRSCLPCHNARTARGGYTLHTFENLMGEGDSGSAIVPGDAHASYLIDLVASGEMPIDAEPLSDDEVELIRRWVAFGARLDAGAGKEMPLVQLMPRPEPQLPPATYPVAPPVTALASTGSGDGQLLASSGYREVLLWTHGGGLVKRISDVLERVYGLSFSPDGKWLAVASGTPGQLGDVSLFSTESGERVAGLVLSADAMLDCCFSPDGDRLAAAGADGKIYLFRVMAREDADGAQPVISANLIATIADHADWVNALAWSDDGCHLASASRDKTAKVFDGQTGEALITFTGHEHNVVDIAFFGDGQQLMSADERGLSLRVWRREDGKQVRELKENFGEVIALVKPEDNRVAVLAIGGRLMTYDPANGTKDTDFTFEAEWPSSVIVDEQGTLWCGDQAGWILEIDSPAKTTASRWLATPSK